MPEQYPAPGTRPRIFVGSSTPNLNVARSLADCLKARNFDAKVWDEFVFQLNESTFDGLLRVAATEVDFAVFVWGASDVTVGNGQTIPSPRDNVVFEAGLFLGILGKHRSFIVVDKTASLKIPSDYLGITRAEYDGSAIGQRYNLSAVSSACSQIEETIRELDDPVREPQIPRDLFRLQGQWKSRFASGPTKDHPVMADDVEISVEPNGISITGASGNIPYTGKARVYHKNQIIGEWSHPSDRSMAEGVFMLVVTQTADSMYGFSTSRDRKGAMIFGTWVFAKKDDNTEQQVVDTLEEGQRFLNDCMISPPIRGAK